ncbi:unnamed protein product [Lampetra planeri]
MAELSRDLQEYLLLSSSSSSSSRPGPGASSQGAAAGSGRGQPQASAWAWPGRGLLPWARAEETAPPSRGDGIIPSLSKKQRIVGFVGFIAMGIFCFSLAAMYAPFMLLKARKFALLYTMGSLFVISSFSLLWGPWSHVRHLCSSERLPFTAAYFGSMVFTLYFALWMQSTLLTSVGAIVQMVALLWYLISYIPGGQAGLQFFTSLFSSAVKRTVSKTLPV